MIGLKFSGVDKASGALRKIAKAVQDKQKLHAVAGRYMVASEVPRIFREGGPPGQGWAPPKMRKGRPLRDTGRLLASISWRATSADVVIGTPLRYAKIQQRGGTIVPTGGKKWLAIPLSPPLSESQRQNAKPRDFHGAFVLIWGPEGPGLYRKAKGAVTASSIFSGGASKYAKGTKGIERIFAFVKSVKIPKRPFLVWTPRALSNIATLWSKTLALEAQKAGGAASATKTVGSAA